MKVSPHAAVRGDLSVVIADHRHATYPGSYALACGAIGRSRVVTNVAVKRNGLASLGGSPWKHDGRRFLRTIGLDARQRFSPSLVAA